MQIQRVDPANADVVRACHAVHVAAHAVDDPEGDPPFSLALFSAHLAHGWSCDPAEAWWVPADSPGGARQGGDVAAYCRLMLPDLENRDRASVSLTVHPAFRRRGLGRVLLRHVADRAAANGRGFLNFHGLPRSAGEAFARRLDAEAGLVDARRFPDLRKVPASRFATLRAEAAEHATGYSLISWTGVTPEEELGRVAGLPNAINDAPRDEG